MGHELQWCLCPRGTSAVTQNSYFQILWKFNFNIFYNGRFVYLIIDRLYAVEGRLDFGDRGKSFKAQCRGRTQRISQKCLIKIVASGPLWESFFFHKLSIKCLWNNFQDKTETCFEWHSKKRNDWKGKIHTCFAHHVTLDLCLKYTSSFFTGIYTECKMKCLSLQVLWIL